MYSGRQSLRTNGNEVRGVHTLGARRIVTHAVRYMFDIWWRGGGSVSLQFINQMHLMPLTWFNGAQGACDTIAWVGWTQEETDAHHIFLSLRFPPIPLPQTSTFAPWFPCKALHTLHWCNPTCSGSIWHVTWGGHYHAQTIPCLEDLLCGLAPPLSCFRDLWQHEILRLGAVAFTVRWSNMDYQCKVSYSLPPAFHYGGWFHFVGGHMVHERSTIRSEVSAFDKSLCSGTHHQEWWYCRWQGLYRPHQEWWCFWYHGLHWPVCQMGRILWKSVTALSGRWVCMALGVLPTYPHRIIIPFPGPLWVWIPPMFTYIRVLWYLWNYHIDTLRCILLF